MSLFGTIQMGANALQAMQIGLQVTGNNIANANTPGYVRQEVVYAPAPVQRIGNLVLGMGVQVDAIIDKIDRFVLDRLVGARGERAGAETREGAYLELESLLNGLSGSVDLGSSFTSFFNAIGEVLDDPTSAAARNLVIGQGTSLAGTINNLWGRAQTVRTEYNNQVTTVAGEINHLTEVIRTLNVQIATIEGGGASKSDAGGLRVARQTAVDRLSEIIGVSVVEQPSGGLNVSVGGDFLVFEGQRRAVEVAFSSGDGMTLSTVRFADTKGTLESSTGQLPALYAARDEIVGGFIKGLDELTGLLAFEFNKVYSQGQGINGFTQAVSQNGVSDAGAALDAAGLAFTPVNGSFHVLIRNKQTGLVQTHAVRVDLDGFDQDTSLGSLAAELDGIDGLTARITSDGRLELRSTSAELQFGFDGDTSGLLAALGLNTFFTGSHAGDLGVNAELLVDGSKFAASGDNETYFGVDIANARRLVSFYDQGVDSLGGTSVVGLYDQLVNQVAQGSAAASALADGFRVFEGSLAATAQAVSGVNLDEEAIDMLLLQQAYQASARYIATLSELLDILVNL